MMRRQNFSNHKWQTEPTGPSPEQQPQMTAVRRRRHVNRYLVHIPLLAVVLTPCLLAVAGAQIPYTDPAPKPSMASKFTSSVKSGFSKMSKTLIPHPSTEKAPDPISLSVSAKPSDDLHLGLARMAERNGDLAKAEDHYRKALELAPKNAEALMGYAHMLDRQQKLAQAGELYRMTVEAYPGNPSAHNDLGICCARQGKLEEAAASLEKAVQLGPNQARYRNNLATVLVQSNRLDDAFVHLSAVHPEAVAYYNLGFLLHGAGDRTAAIRLFQEALSVDPSLTQARAWLEKLQPSGTIVREPARQPQAVAQRPAPRTAPVIPPAGSAAPLPPAGTPGMMSPMPQTAPRQLTPPPQTAVPGQTPPANLAPLPSIKPLPPIHRN